MTALNSYKDGVVTRLYKGLQGLAQVSRNITIVEGDRHASPARTRSSSVNGTEYTAPNVVLATGSVRQAALPWPGDRRHADPHQQTTRMRLEEVPNSVDRPGRRRDRRASSPVACSRASASTSPSSRRCRTARSATRTSSNVQAARARLPPPQDRLQDRRAVSPVHRTDGSDSVTVTLEDGEDAGPPTCLLVAVGRGPSSAPASGSRRQVSRWNAASCSSTSTCRTNVDGRLRRR